MKYKTLCRLLIKLVGLYFVAAALSTLGPAMWGAISYIRNGEGMGRALYVGWMVVPCGNLLTGILLIRASGWIASILIPSNRPYCHECGYDLTGAMGSVCPECGTEFRSAPIKSEPHH